jgi:hypothetical protein
LNFLDDALSLLADDEKAIPSIKQKKYRPSINIERDYNQQETNTSKAIDASHKEDIYRLFLFGYF